MRKVLSLLLTLTLLVSSSAASFASEIYQTKDSNSISVERTIDGKYVLSKKSGEVARRCEEDGVYQLSDGTLLSLTGTSQLQQVEKVSFQLTDEAKLNYVLQNHNLPKEVQEGLISSSNKAIATNNQNARISLVVPYTPMTRGTQNIYYTYNGKPMRDFTIFSFGENTGYEYIENGTKSRSFAEFTSSAVITGLGFVKHVSLIAGGVSIFSAWESYVGDTNFSGRSSDFVQALVNYDVSTKYTYVDIGNGWEIGLTSQNVYINYIKTVQYYADSTFNESYYTDYSIRKTVTSPNFFNPAPVAINHILNPMNETLKMEVGDMTLHF